MSAWVYILLSKKDNKKYIGSTTDLDRRIEQHKSGQVPSTKNRLPVDLWGFQQFENIQEAAIFEKKFKRSHDLIQRMIKLGKFRLVSGA